MTDRSSRPCMCGASTAAQSHDPTCYWHDPLWDKPAEPPAEISVFMGWHGVRLFTSDPLKAELFSAQNDGIRPTVYRVEQPHSYLDAKAIAAAVVQSACESDPADDDHPDTILITTDELEVIVRNAVENHHA